MVGPYNSSMDWAFRPLIGRIHHVIGLFQTRSDRLAGPKIHIVSLAFDELKMDDTAVCVECSEISHLRNLTIF